MNENCARKSAAVIMMKGPQHVLGDVSIDAKYVETS